MKIWLIIIQFGYQFDMLFFSTGYSLEKIIITHIGQLFVEIFPRYHFNRPLFPLKFYCMKFASISDHF